MVPLSVMEQHRRCPQLFTFVFRADTSYSSFISAVHIWTPLLGVEK